MSERRPGSEFPFAPAPVRSEAVRELRIRAEGWEMFRDWAQALAEAEAEGEVVPSLQDVDAVVAWLHDHDEIEHPVTTEQARLLIEMCLKGGQGAVQTT